jgi:hypothetical protein
VLGLDRRGARASAGRHRRQAAKRPKRPPIRSPRPPCGELAIPCGRLCAPCGTPPLLRAGPAPCGTSATGGPLRLPCGRADPPDGGPDSPCEEPGRLAAAPRSVHHGPFGLDGSSPPVAAATRGSVHEIRRRARSCPRRVHATVPNRRVASRASRAETAASRGQETRRRYPQMGQEATPVRASRLSVVGQPFVPQ